jgi:FAD/FMN-containing dehydrogenase
MTQSRLASWGNHPAATQGSTPCFWRDDLPADFAKARQQHGTTLAFGSGRSYGDSCLAASGHVLDMRTLDRFIEVDWEAGTLRAEAGTTLDEVLALTVPRRWYLPVTPGTRFVTLGGAVANDVHGKNHHRRGTFGRHVRRLSLLRSDGRRFICSPAQDAALFAATLGGLGLTGVIEWVEVDLLPIRSGMVEGVRQRFGNILEFFALSQELDDQHEFSVSWIDCTAARAGVGRGIYSAGNFAADGPLVQPARRERAVPFTPPLSLVNGVTVRAFNGMYWRRAPAARQRERQFHEAYLYPLDAVGHWNRIYGRRGFQQYQCVVPEPQVRDAIPAMLTDIANAGMGSFLAVLKRCGDLPSPGLLSFPMPGVSLAIDFAQDANPDERLFPRLDALVREAGGRLYPAKDAHMRPEDFRRWYPRWPEVEALRDPALLSRFWRRVLG